MREMTGNITGRRPAEFQFELTGLTGPHAPAKARDLLRNAAKIVWGPEYEEFGFDSSVVIQEMVANGIRTGQSAQGRILTGKVDVRVYFQSVGGTKQIRMEVDDEIQQEPERDMLLGGVLQTSTSASSEGGRGLLIIKGYTNGNAGVEPPRRGSARKTVWAEMNYDQWFAESGR